jgi:ribosome-associated translation inhibitor RaiA/DNA-directed RNA polymerase specialized sigma24 family protein
MNIEITFRHIEKKAKKYIKNEVNAIVERHLTPLLNHFNSKQLRLHATVEEKKSANNTSYNVVLRLSLPPKKTLASTENGDNLTTVINKATEELARQVNKHTARISGREQWKRKARRQRLDEITSSVSETLTAEQQQQAQQEVASLLPKMERYIRHELTYLRVAGDLAPDYPSIDDILNEALVRLKINWQKLSGNDDKIYQQFLNVLHQILAQEVAEHRLHAQDIALEDQVSADASEQAESMVEEEIFEYYQPEESVHIEDIMPDNAALTPEQQAENEAREHCYRLMAKMPNQWRNVLVLVYQEDISLDDIANNIMQKTLAQSQRLLEYAESYMLDSLVDFGVPQASKETLRRLLRLH